jgi:hypothetical protein
VEDRLDDLQVYSELHRIVEGLDAMAKRCQSLAASTALKAAAGAIRIMASGLYRNGLHACGNVDKSAENCEKV